MEKSENVHQNLAPDPFLILLNDRKQPLHARNKEFWKRIIKKPLKNLSLLFLSNPAILMDKFIKNKRGLEPVPLLANETSSEKFL